MNDVLIAIVNALGRFYNFGGVVTPESEVVVGEEKVFFLATQTGTYPNLGNLSVAEGEIFVLFTHDTSWAKIVIDLTKLMAIVNGAIQTEKERAEEVEQTLLDRTAGIQRVSGSITIIDGIEIGALKNIAESAKLDAEDAKMEAQQTSIKTVEVTTDGNLLIVPKSGAPITFSPLKLAEVLEITGDVEQLEVGSNLVAAVNEVFNMAVSAGSTANEAKSTANAALTEAQKKVERVELIYHHDTNNITLVGSETPLTFAQIATFVEDPTKFVTMYGYDGDFLLPQYYDGGALTFTGLSVFEDYTASHRVIINIDDEIKNEVFDLARKSDLADYAKESELTALQLKVGEFDVKTATALPFTNIPEDNTIYNIGEVATLVVAGVPTDNKMGAVINFHSGATATQLQYPASSKWNTDADPTIDADADYQLTILDGVFAIAKISTLTQA